MDLFQQTLFMYNIRELLIMDKTHDTHGSISLDIKRKDNDMFIKSIKQAKTRSEIPQAAIIDEKQKMNEYEKYKM